MVPAKLNYVSNENRHNCEEKTLGMHVLHAARGIACFDLKCSCIESISPVIYDVSLSISLFLAYKGKKTRECMFYYCYYYVQYTNWTIYYLWQKRTVELIPRQPRIVEDYCVINVLNWRLCPVYRYDTWYVSGAVYSLHNFLGKTSSLPWTSFPCLYWI